MSTIKGHNLIHVKGYKLNQVAQLVEHIMRNHVSYKNKNINQDLIQNNVILIDKLNFKNNKNIETILVDYLQKNKIHYTEERNNILCSFLLRSNDYIKELNPRKEDILNLFNKQIKELEKKFPEMEIIAAVIHFDEELPHLHLTTLPIIETKKDFNLKEVKKEFTKLGYGQDKKNDKAFINEWKANNKKIVKQLSMKSYWNDKFEMIKFQNYWFETCQKVYKNLNIDIEVIRRKRETGTKYIKNVEDYKNEILELTKNFQISKDFTSIKKSIDSLTEKALHKPIFHSKDFENELSNLKNNVLDKITNKFVDINLRKNLETFSKDKEIEFLKMEKKTQSIEFENKLDKQYKFQNIDKYINKKSIEILDKEQTINNLNIKSKNLETAYNNLDYKYQEKEKQLEINYNNKKSNLTKELENKQNEINSINEQLNNRKVEFNQWKQIIAETQRLKEEEIKLKEKIKKLQEEYNNNLEILKNKVELTPTEIKEQKNILLQDIKLNDEEIKNQKNDLASKITLTEDEKTKVINYRINQIQLTDKEVEQQKEILISKINITPEELESRKDEIFKEISRDISDDMNSLPTLFDLLIDISKKAYEYEEILDDYTNEQKEVLKDFVEAKYYDELIDINDKFEQGHYEKIVKEKVEKIKKEKNHGFER